MRIAREIGGFTVDELEERISLDEWHEWIEHFRREDEAMKKAQTKSGMGAGQPAPPARRRGRR